MNFKTRSQIDFVSLAFEVVLGRRPTNVELNQCVLFLREQSELLSEGSKLTRFVGGKSSNVLPSIDPQMRARESLILVLFNHNDFVTIR